MMGSDRILVGGSAIAHLLRTNRGCPLVPYKVGKDSGILEGLDAPLKFNHSCGES